MNSSQPPGGAASRLICTLPSACAETYFPCELLSVIFPPGRSSIWKYSHVLATSRFHCALPSGCALRNFPCTLRRATCAIASPPPCLSVMVRINQFFGLRNIMQRGLGRPREIYPQINQIETAIPIKVGTTAAKIKIMPAFLLMGASSSSVNS